PTTGFNVETDAGSGSTPSTRNVATGMASTSTQDGFRQAMLKSALDTIPQLTEENYSIWKDKMSALLKLRGALINLENNLPFDADMEAELILLIISKMDSVTHNNVVTADNRDSPGKLWMAIKEKFASSQASNRARVFKEFLYTKFKEDEVEGFITDTKVSIKKLVDVGIDLPQDIIAYLILFKFPESLQSLKRQIMHSDKELTAEFVYNHLNQVNNESKAKSKDAAPTNQAALFSNKGKNRPNTRLDQNVSSGKRCTNGYHNPKQDANHSSDSCWHLHPDKAPEWWGEAQSKWEASKKSNYYMSLVTLWVESGNSNSRIILDSGSSSHVFNDKRFFDQLELGDFDSIKTGKKDANLAIKGTGQVTLSWGRMTVSLKNCLYVPDIVVNLISPGLLDKKGCTVSATGGKFQVLKNGLVLFSGRIRNNMYAVRNPDKIGSQNQYINYTNNKTGSLQEIHEKYAHASMQRIKSLIPESFSSVELKNFECKDCILSKITKQSFNLESHRASKVFMKGSTLI
ncbi:hypothetical protein VP01_5024g1, partial [Puccinia sorghi]